MVAGRVKQVVVLYSNDCTGIRWGGLSIGRLRRVVVLQRWSSEQVWLQCFEGCVRYICASFFFKSKESTCQTSKNAFYFTSKALFVLKKIKF